MEFSTIEQAIDTFRNGGFVIVVDDQDRENEGDFIMAAEKITPETVNFMAREGRGLICVPITEDRAVELSLEPMEHENTAIHQTSFTVSVDYRKGTTTGISAQDRAKTIAALVENEVAPEDFARPGHVFPLVAKEGGVLHRAGHTEAAVDLARLAGLKPAGVLCEIMAKDGSMARLPELREMAEEFDIPLITIADLIEYRRHREKLVQFVQQVNLPTNNFGEWELRLYQTELDKNDHIVLVKGDINPEDPVLVRVHSECLTGDVFGSQRCDCGDQLNEAMRIINDEGAGVVLYLRQEGRGIGLKHKILAYKLQEEGYDTVEANVELGFSPDLREYGIGAQILTDVGVRRMRLLTNNPHKYIGLTGYGLELEERVPLEIKSNKNNREYLKTKRDKMGHLLQMADLDE
ncbi:MAG: bifunctional 3,4-dihydroxy-2-butanone-4-phosphate synthase/GTP cyclohydrolase II [Candidatus Marinimicrobia bacterium]|nr:bifunctional 3,4-dihydroxy-2-butanone-4-phosphate synthase/GTP cyclohydrolase II [Candidatus Neomarinimicrobiota bacterium]MCF7828894.1 bifunctional 3,4-dihydroxy-2-butanone-4-phosphate synthase/GTP cyclohydrolase II [Candidatus Neomarinimicrobiota bacterium]MCF7879854.1 bifunctional 3,4-dihydroxy-2-butanone-4-phosphate synthase/GTP cyclohydrolase II [Candidatus Neomarinimicrobiota bacterium]